MDDSDRLRSSPPMSPASENAISPAPRAVLWDMDGTLLDSAEYHWLTWKEILEV